MDYLIALIQQYGLGFVFLNVLALQAGLPLPAYPTLIVAGALAAAGGTPVYQLVGVGVAGALIPATGWDHPGGRFGLGDPRGFWRGPASAADLRPATRTGVPRLRPA